MTPATWTEDRRAPEFESATRVAVVAALSATTMLFASLVSAYLVRRSFPDWRPVSATWPLALLASALASSFGVEVASRAEEGWRRLGLIGLGLGSGLYLLGVIAVIVSVVSEPFGLATPFNAFVFLLLGLHAAHAIAGGAFSGWILRAGSHPASESGFLLARLVTHFLTVLLCAILFLLFVLR
ncbi:MAG: hypothetical protein ABI565_07490 [Vicinamibacteria bacterium]